MIALHEKVKFLQVNYDAIFQLTSSLIGVIFGGNIYKLTKNV